MVVPCLNAVNDKMMKSKETYINDFMDQIRKRSDKLMNYFLAGYFVIGLILAFYYDTWLIAIGVGGQSILGYYVSKWALPNSNQYQYVLSTVFGIFMAQFIYQMHGMFEMHFFAFIGSAILITYQNWKLQIPMAVLVLVHHGAFGYLQYMGYEEIYFTQLNYMTLQTFVIHGLLATTVFFLCGFWAYNIKRINTTQIIQSLEIGVLQNDMLEKIRVEENLIRTGNEMRNFTKHLNEVVEEERKRIAGEIHDELGQRLVGIKMGLSSFSKKVSSIKGAPERIREIVEDADKAIHSMKKIVTELRPAILDTLGLFPSIEWLVKQVEKNSDIKCRLSLPIKDMEFSNTFSACFFRICQEALTNVLKHSGATEVNVSVNEEGNILLLNITDNGKGMEMEEPEFVNSGSMGLLGMRERAKMMGAELIIDSKLNAGTIITLKSSLN
jgi:signal transduction histidine kinase